MDPDQLRALLDSVAAGTLSPDTAMGKLDGWPYKDLGFARYDTDRARRKGFPEVIFGQGKTVDQITALVEVARDRHGIAMVTRVMADAAEQIVSRVPDLTYDHEARALYLGRESVSLRGRGTIVVVSAGTADLPVAAEAALTAELMGNQIERIHDVGVAGLHRILSVRDSLEAATVIVVVAGMEGALVPVVAGLVDRPVVAVPTSVGYGAQLSGWTPLLGMLSACAPGIGVVNIDNGFGAGYLAALINRR